MPQISIIVPVYKVEKYINRCIDSILTQTFTDFELILVDDGSPDNCPAICDRYVSKDNRVKVIHKKNGGVSSARNSALDIAQGEYITFVDADDLLEQNALYALLDGMKSLENGLVIGGIVSETIDRTQKRTTINYQTNREWILVRSDKYSSEYDKVWNGNNMLSAWGKMFSRKVVEEQHIRFNTRLVVMEDATFVLEYLKYGSGIVSISDIVYRVFDFVGRNSWLHRSRHDYINDLLVASDSMKEFLKHYRIPSNAACNSQLYSCFDVGLISLWSMPYGNYTEKIRKYKRIREVLRIPKYQEYIKQNRGKYSKLEYQLMKHGNPIGLQLLWKVRTII